MKKQTLYAELTRMKNLAGLIKESDLETIKSFEEYSNDALTDMIANLSKFENTEEDVQRINSELERRKKENKADF